MTAQPEGNDTPDMTPEEAAAFAQWFEDYADAEDEAKKLAVKLGYVEKTATTGVDDAEKKADRVEALQVQIDEQRSGYGADIARQRRETSAPEMSETAPTPAPAAPVVAGSTPDLDHCPPTQQAEDEANGTFNEAPQPVPAAPPEAVLMPAQAQQSPLDTPPPELTPAPQPEPAQPLPPSQAVPTVAESAPDFDNCLPTPHVATLFDSLPFSAENWTKRLSDAKWLQTAKRSAGEQGGVSAMWCPLALAMAIHSHKKGVKEKATALKKLNSLFMRSDLLAPHRDAWGKYFQLMSND